MHEAGADKRNGASAMRHSPFLKMSAEEDEERGYSYRVHLHQTLVIEQGAISSQKLRCVISCGDGSGERGHVRGQHSSKQLCGGPASCARCFGGGRASAITAMAPAAAQRTHAALNQNTKAVANEGS